MSRKYAITAGRRQECARAPPMHPHVIAFLVLEGKALYAANTEVGGHTVSISPTLL